MIDLNDYSAKYLQQYEEESFETILVRVRRKIVQESLERWPHRRILEVGCGMEPLFEFVSGHDEYTVIEPCGEFIRHARDLAVASDVDLLDGFLEDRAEQLARKSFDFIVVSSLLHEVSDPKSFLAAIRRLCQVDTVVHFNVPNVRSFHRLLALEMGMITDLFEQSETERQFQRHTRFDGAALRSMLAKEGFQIIESATYFVKPFTHAQMEGLLRTGQFPPSLILGLERMTKYMPDLGCEVYANVRLR